MKAQKTLSVHEAHVAKAAQDVVTQRLADAQKAAQESMQITQQYETRLAELTTKMSNMEALLVTQWQKSQRLESELSAAQDRIGGAERRDLQSWHEWYDEDIGESPPNMLVSSDTPSTIPISIESSLFSFTAPSNKEPSAVASNVPTSIPIFPRLYPCYQPLLYQ